MKVPVIRNVMEANERIAQDNKRLFDSHKVFVLNLMSAPGAGKTSLLERTIPLLRQSLKIGVIEGDIQTSRDAERIAAHGIPVVQINTNGACHLDGAMIRETLSHFDLPSLDLLVVENVGNLVCPAEFNLGEDMKVMLLSVTEGEDKPQKYPLMFRESKALILNKIDLVPYLDIDMNLLKEEAMKVNPGLLLFEVSCKTGEGIQNWCQFLEQKVREKKGK